MITWRSKSNTRLINTSVDVDSKKVIMGNFVVYKEKDTATEAEIILLIKASTVNNSDNVRSKSVIFIINLDIN
jgi:hypothetical protein